MEIRIPYEKDALRNYNPKTKLTLDELSNMEGGEFRDLSASFKLFVNEDIITNNLRINHISDIAELDIVTKNSKTGRIATWEVKNHGTGVKYDPSSISYHIRCARRTAVNAKRVVNKSMGKFVHETSTLDLKKHEVYDHIGVDDNYLIIVSRLDIALTVDQYQLIKTNSGFIYYLLKKSFVKFYKSGKTFIVENRHKKDLKRKWASLLLLEAKLASLSKRGLKQKHITTYGGKRLSMDSVSSRIIEEARMEYDEIYKNNKISKPKAKKLLDLMEIEGDNPESWFPHESVNEYASYLDELITKGN